jgi:hypothetical protein
MMHPIMPIEAMPPDGTRMPGHGHCALSLFAFATQLKGSRIAKWLHGPP